MAAIVADMINRLSWSLLLLVVISPVRPDTSPRLHDVPSKVPLNPAALGLQNLPWNFTAPSSSLPTMGHVPTWLRGTLYRNGPVRWEERTWHWFEGLAMVHAFRFDAGKISYNNQYVRSEVYNKSMPHNDGFVDETPPNLAHSISDWVRMRTERYLRAPSVMESGRGRGGPAQHYSTNTDVTIRRVESHVLCNGASTDSNEVEPLSLNTISTPFLFEDDLPFSPAPSHAHTDPAGNIVHFFYQYKPFPGYQVYELPVGERKRRLLGKPIHAPNVSSPFFLHSFALTENYVVICEVPSLVIEGNFRTAKFLKELGTRWHVLSRSSGDYVSSFKTTEAFFMYHHVNAYEEKAGNSVELVVDIVSYPNMDTLTAMFINTILDTPEVLMKTFSEGGLHRYRLPLSQPGSEVRGTKVGPPMELPTIYYEQYNTKKHRFVYGVGWKKIESGFFDSLVKVDLQTGDVKEYFEPNTNPGEPIFHPSPGATAEDDGVLFSVVLDTVKGHSFLLILNATTFHKIATADVSYAIPFGFHGRHY